MRVRVTDLARPHSVAWGRCPPWSAEGSWSPPATWLWSRGGQANFYLQSANPQIFGLTLQSEIRKFRRCARPQITNPQIFMINPQIANPQISNKYSTTLSQNSPKSYGISKRFISVQIWIWALYVIIVGRKAMSLRTFRSFKCTHHKGTANRKFVKVPPLWKVPKI